MRITLHIIFINHYQSQNALLYISHDVTTYNIDVIHPLHNLYTVLLYYTAITKYILLK